MAKSGTLLSWRHAACKHPGRWHRGRLVAVATCGLLLAGGLIPRWVGLPRRPPPRRLRPDAAGVTWLCRPGQPGDPCLFPEGAVSVAANGARNVLPAPTATKPEFDCFYIYPTVTAGSRTQHRTAVQPAAEAARSRRRRASRRSATCGRPSIASRPRRADQGRCSDPTAEIAYAACCRRGRTTSPTTTTAGRSSSSATPRARPMLIRLLEPGRHERRAARADGLGDHPGRQRRGAGGQDVGATFQQHPRLHRRGQTGCVIAYSSFPSQPPSDSLFGIPGQGVSLQSDQTDPPRARRCSAPTPLRWP